MSKKNLTKVEALELICPVVDGEATEQEVKAFEAYIEEDPEVREKYNQIKQVKSAVSNRCPRAEAPDTLVHFLKNAEKKTKKDFQQSSKSDSTLNGSDPENNNTHPSSPDSQDSNNNSKKYLYAAAASFLLIAAAWSFFSIPGSPSTQQTNYIEHHIAKHYNQNQGQLIEPDILTSDVGSAEVELKNKYKIELKIPALQGANFEGVVYRDFIDEFKTPMLEYTIPERKDTIYVFAFRMDDLSQENRLMLFPDALKSVIRSQDYYIRELGGKQMVHWKWNSIWYTAISNEDGNSLAARIEELKNDVTRL